MAAVTGLPTDVVSAFLARSRVENSTAKTASSSGSNEHAVVVTPFNDFVTDNVPSVFRIQRKSLEADPEKEFAPFELINSDDVTLCIDKPRADWFPQNKGCILKFEDALQLSTLTGTLLSRPILMIARIRYTTTSIKKAYRDFLLLINTKYPDIRKPMEKAFDDAMRRARRGNLLAIEFDFSGIIIQWVRRLLHQWDPSSPSSLSISTPLTFEAKIPEITCAGARLVVTNTTAMKTTYMCRNRDSAIAFICCLPCCLLTCPCYRIHRYLTVHDERLVFSADVTFLPLAHKLFRTEKDSLQFLRNSLLTCSEDTETIADLKIGRDPDPEILDRYLEVNEIMMTPLPKQ